MNTTHACNYLCLAAMCLLIVSTGCRNRAPYCPPGCYPNAQPLNGVMGATTVPAPSTYSINIPGQTQPYYNANATAQVPTPSSGTLPTGNGWRQAGSTSAAPLNPQPKTPNTTNPTSQSQQTTPNRLTSVIDRPGIRGQTGVNNNNGLSFTNDSNFVTTAVDERRDQSRLPVTDASQVRAPTTFTPATATAIGQFNNPYYNQTAFNQIPYNQGVRVAQANPQYYQQPLNYGVVPTVASPNVVVGTFAQPTFAQPPQQIYQGLTTQNPEVLAQSTVYTDPSNNPNFENGWRDRELTASRNALNR